MDIELAELYMKMAKEDNPGVTITDVARACVTIVETFEERIQELESKLDEFGLI